MGDPFRACSGASSRPMWIHGEDGNRSATASTTCSTKWSVAGPPGTSTLSVKYCTLAAADSVIWIAENRQHGQRGMAREPASRPLGRARIRRASPAQPTGDLVACLAPVRIVADQPPSIGGIRGPSPARCRLLAQLGRRRPATSIPRRRTGGGATETACARRRRRSGGRRRPVRTIAWRDRCADLGTRGEAHPAPGPRRAARTPTIRQSVTNRARTARVVAATTPTASPSTGGDTPLFGSSGIEREAVTRRHRCRASRPGRRAGHGWRTGIEHRSRRAPGAAPERCRFRSDGAAGSTRSSGRVGDNRRQRQ